MIDFHNHVVHNIDDGAKDLQTSIEMIKKASSMGISSIVNTVHYNHPLMKYKFPDFNFIDNQIDKINSSLKDEKINMKIYSSAEVYFDSKILDFIDNKNIIIGQKYMLIEFDFNILPKNYEHILFELQLNGITPIIAHPERYRFVHNDYSIIKKWIDKDYKLQVNCGSLLKRFGNQSYYSATKILENGNAHLIGSDAHNNNRRNFCIKDAISLIKNNFNNGSDKVLIDNAYNLLKGEILDECPSLISKKPSIIKKIKNWLIMKNYYKVS